jgi:DNA-directed RNA polymerase specialized sigma54-like protein
MKKETYDTVGIVSVLLNDKLDELKACQAEKESLLEWIDKITREGLLEQNAAKIREYMAANLQRFQKVVAEIEALKKHAE